MRLGRLAPLDQGRQPGRRAEREQQGSPRWCTCGPRRSPDHRLAGRAELRRADLAGEPMPHWAGTPDPAAAAHWTGTDTPAP
ncbi:hypothetical protein, partial [Trebonia sp.]|uniref:hypothetical protein n=1 Tax=Trebonia sp. TaxID=2767075 RepID=UPI00261A5CF4